MTNILHSVVNICVSPLDLIFLFWLIILIKCAGKFEMSIDLNSLKLLLYVQNIDASFNLTWLN